MNETTVIIVWILAICSFIVVLARWFLHEKDSDYFTVDDYTIKDFYTRRKR